jgi:hypothetical protein
MPRRFGTRRALLRSAAVWTPRQLSGLTAWYDGQEITTLYQDSALTTPAGNGDVIGGWVDKSGNGYTMTQATTANKPTMTAASLNGIAAPIYDGGDYLFNAALGALFSGSDVPFSVWIVVKQTNLIGTQVMCGLGNSATNTPYNLLSSAGGSYNVNRVGDDGGSVGVPGGVPDTNAHVIGVTFSGVTVSAFCDGVTIINNQAQNVNTMTVDQFAIGGLLRVGFGLGVVAAIGEFAMVNRAVNNAEAGQLTRYIGKKWGVSVS